MTTCLTEAELQAYLDGELETTSSARVAAHLAECAECARRAGEAEERLDAISLAVSAALPSTIPSDQLRSRIYTQLAVNGTSPAHISLTDRLVRLFGRFVSLRLAAAFVVVVLVAGVLFVSGRVERERGIPRAGGSEGEVASAPPTRSDDIVRATASDVPTQTPRQERRQESGGRNIVRAKSYRGDAAATAQSDSSIAELFDETYLFDPETTRHLERAEVLLRSFDNAMFDRSRSSARAVAYDRQESKGLLYQNVILRREAEADENIPAKSVLHSLEPFLLDIANLPEKPRSEELLWVKERIRNSDIVTALQVYSTRAASM